MGKIAVLFAQTNGIYSKLPDIDLWDETRASSTCPRTREPQHPERLLSYSFGLLARAEGRLESALQSVLSKT